MIKNLRFIYDKKIHSSAVINVLARIKESSLARDCSIGRKARILRSEIGPKCEIGKRVRIKSSRLEGFNVIASAVRMENVSVGFYSYFASASSLTEIAIGKFCSIGPRVMNHLGNHPTKKFVSSHPSFYAPDSPTKTFVTERHFSDYGQSITVGSDVWLGAESLLMDGITVGNGAIIGARSVVTKDVPPYAIVAGVPARIIRYRFDEESVKLLEESRWWDWDISYIIESIHIFHDVEKFIAALKAECR